MNEMTGRVLAELKSRLSALYGERLKGVHLFGSYARNEADEESDLDLLVVLDEVENYSREITRTSELVSELSLKYGISISRSRLSCVKKACNTASIRESIPHSASILPRLASLTLSITAVAPGCF